MRGIIRCPGVRSPDIDCKESSSDTGDDVGDCTESPVSDNLRAPMSFAIAITPLSCCFGSPHTLSPVDDVVDSWPEPDGFEGDGAWTIRLVEEWLGGGAVLTDDRGDTGLCNTLELS